MKLSTLIKELFNASEFTSPNSLANYTQQTQPFTDAFINSSKSSREKEDVLFEELTKDITVSELLSAIALIKHIKNDNSDRFL